jgi:hypothetical protein
MKRAAIARCADVHPRRFDLLEQRQQLPFETDKGRKAYSLDEAFRLRLMLDLIGREGEGEDEHGGLPTSYACKVVANIMGCFRRHPLKQIEPTEWWVGVVIFETESEKQTDRRSAWFVGEIENLSAWIKAEGSNMRTEGSDRPVRVFLANASRAAEFIRNRAEKMGLPEADFAHDPEAKL